MWMKRWRNWIPWIAIFALLLGGAFRGHYFPDFVCKGPYVDVRAYASINAAVTDIGASEKTIFVPDNQSLVAAATIPTTLHLKIQPPGRVTLGDYNLAINSPLTAPISQIFDDSGSGSVSFGSGYVENVYPQWWGADPTSTNDQSAYMNAAALSIDGGDAILRLTSATWYCKDFLPKEGCIVQGSGHSTILKAYDNPSAAIVIVQHPSIVIKDLTIDGNTGGGKTAVGFIFQQTDGDQNLRM